MSPLLLLAGLVALYLLVRPGRVITLRDGAARCTRGKVPNGLLADLDDLARSLPAARASVSLAGKGADLRVTVRGLDEGAAQRVRNIVGLHRPRL